MIGSTFANVELPSIDYDHAAMHLGITGVPRGRTAADLDPAEFPAPAPG